MGLLSATLCKVPCSYLQKLFNVLCHNDFFSHRNTAGNSRKSIYKTVSECTATALNLICFLFPFN